MVLVGVRQDEDVDVGNLAVELLAEVEQVLVDVVAAGIVLVAGLGRRVAIDDDLGVVAQRDQRAVAVADREVGDTGVHCTFSNLSNEIKLAVGFGVPARYRKQIPSTFSSGWTALLFVDLRATQLDSFGPET